MGWRARCLARWPRVQFDEPGTRRSSCELQKWLAEAGTNDARTNLRTQARQIADLKRLQSRPQNPHTDLRRIRSAFFTESANGRVRDCVFENANRPHSHLPRQGTRFGDYVAYRSALEKISRGAHLG